MAALTEEQKYAEARSKRIRYEHDAFFDAPTDGLTEDERRARGPMSDDPQE